MNVNSLRLQRLLDPGIQVSLFINYCREVVCVVINGAHVSQVNQGQAGLVPELQLEC